MFENLFLRTRSFQDKTLQGKADTKPHWVQSSRLQLSRALRLEGSCPALGCHSRRGRIRPKNPQLPEFCAGGHHDRQPNKKNETYASGLVMLLNKSISEQDVFNHVWLCVSLRAISLCILTLGQCKCLFHLATRCHHSLRYKDAMREAVEFFGQLQTELTYFCGINRFVKLKLDYPCCWGYHFCWVFFEGWGYHVV